MNFVLQMDFDSLKLNFNISIFICTIFLVSCLLQYPLPGLVSRVHHYKWHPLFYHYKWRINPGIYC